MIIWRKMFPGRMIYVTDRITGIIRIMKTIPEDTYLGKLNHSVASLSR